jgi:hypothetical protein
VRDTDPFPTLHERHIPVEMARRELSVFLVDVAAKYNLTSAEYLSLLVSEVQNRVATHLRAERNKDA